MFSNVYIYGLGMMGGSLAKSIKKKNLAKNIYGFDINPVSYTHLRAHET